MKILIGAAIGLVALGFATAAGKAESRGRAACEALKSAATCYSRTDCVWTAKAKPPKCRKAAR